LLEASSKSRVGPQSTQPHNCAWSEVSQPLWSSLLRCFLSVFVCTPMKKSKQTPRSLSCFYILCQYYTLLLIFQQSSLIFPHSCARMWPCVSVVTSLKFLRLSLLHYLIPTLWHKSVMICSILCRNYCAIASSRLIYYTECCIMSGGISCQVYMWLMIGLGSNKLFLIKYLLVPSSSDYFSFILLIFSQLSNFQLIIS